MKRITNLLHLLTGIALLAIAAYFIRELAHNGKRAWQRESSVVAHPARSARSSAGSDDPLLSATNVPMDGTPVQPDDGTGADDAVPAPSSGPPSLLDHLNAANAGAPNHFLHRRLSVETYQIFAFEVPPRAIRPELRGNFRSVATRRSPGGASVELLLLNDGEFARFVKNRPVTAAFSSNPSSRGEIHWKLNANIDNPRKYYLVFRNSLEGQGPSLVDADFTASFE